MNSFLKITSLLSCYLILLFSSSFSQNLVPNPSFEQFTACPDTFIGPGGSNLTAVNDWFNAGGFTPDYLNSCDTNITNPLYGVPLNQYGYQSARTGIGYAGIILSDLYATAADSLREYIEVKLSNNLIPGKSYAVSFYVSLADSAPYANNDIGAYFSTTIISFPSNPYPLPFTPQIKNNPLITPLTNKITWTEVKDTLVAQGGEQYMIIGNFKNDATTDTTTLQDGNPQYSPWAYYYIDDVSVICLNCLDGIGSVEHDGRVNIFPNPSHGLANIVIENRVLEKIELMEFSGKAIQIPFTTKNNCNTIDLTHMKRGIYLIQIKTIDGTTYRKKIILN